MPEAAASAGWDSGSNRTSDGHWTRRQPSSHLLTTHTTSEARVCGPKPIYAGTSFDLSTNAAQTFELCNDGTAGTSLNFLAKLNGASSSCAVKMATSDTAGALGVVVGGSGTTGNAVIVYRGFASCSFDGSTTAGDYIQISSSNAADCHDSG